jgi:hypothetical protein
LVQSPALAKNVVAPMGGEAGGVTDSTGKVAGSGATSSATTSSPFFTPRNVTSSCRAEPPSATVIIAPSVTALAALPSAPVALVDSSAPLASW